MPVDQMLEQVSKHLGEISALDCIRGFSVSAVISFCSIRNLLFSLLGYDLTHTPPKITSVTPPTFPRVRIHQSKHIHGALASLHGQVRA